MKKIKIDGVIAIDEMLHKIYGLLKILQVQQTGTWILNQDSLWKTKLISAGII